MIDRGHGLPVTRQAQALGVSRSTVYYKPRPVSAEDLRIMRLIDELHLDHPFAGAAARQRRLYRSPPCGDADETHGDRGDLSPAEHKQARARPPRLTSSGTERRSWLKEPPDAVDVAEAE